MRKPLHRHDNRELRDEANREREHHRYGRRDEWQRRASRSPPPARLFLRDPDQLHGQHPPRNYRRPSLSFNDDVRHHDYDALPDSHTDKRFDASTLKTSKGKDLRYYVARNGTLQPSSSVGSDPRGKDILIPSRSIYLDDAHGDVTYFTLPPENATYDAPPPNMVSQSIGGATGVVPTPTGVGICEQEDVRYLDHLRERYAGQKPKLYARDIPYYGSEQRTRGSVSSSRATEDDFFHPYQDSSFQSSPKHFGRGSRASNFTGEPSGFDDYSQRRPFNTVKRRPVSPLICDESHDYLYSDCARTERPDHGPPLTFSGIYMQKPRRTRDDYPEVIRQTFTGPYEERFEEFDASPDALRNSNSRDQNVFLRRRPIRSRDTHDEDIPIMKHSEFSGPPLDHEFAETGGGYEYLRDGTLEYYREGSMSPHSFDQYVEAYTENINPSRGRVSMEDVDGYKPDLPYDRMSSRRKYDINEQDRIHPGSLFPRTRKRRAVVGNEPWTSETRMRLASLKRIGFGRSKPTTSSCRDQDGENINLKKQLKPSPSDFHGSFKLNRKQDFYKHYKFQNKNMDDQHGFEVAYDGDLLQDDLHLRSDVMEDSDEFKEQVHKCFLRFSKLLNENPHKWKIFQEQGKASSLDCCICGSLSKEFTDTHSLVMHAYNCLKTRFRADHLGLHKALCVLMGWSWQVAPDNGKLYQSSLAEDVKALKDDLIIWPPIVIVHDSSIRNNNLAIGQRIIDSEGMAAILRGIGFAAGKTRVCRGKHTDHGVMLVKFFPTFSGLQEAEKLHKYYVDNKQGRKEFEEINSSSSAANQATEAEVERLLFGYMATAADMDNLDWETKKRCVIKSKKDIEAIADAPLTS